MFDYLVEINSNAKSKPKRRFRVLYNSLLEENVFTRLLNLIFVLSFSQIKEGGTRCTFITDLYKTAHLNSESRPNHSGPKPAVPFFVASPIFVRAGALTLTLLPAILSVVRLRLMLRGPRQRAAKDDRKSPCYPVVYTLLSQAR